ncbi:dihydrofolate reductase [Haloactinopolyspora alba]|uniref:Dihydrofolate reductase n=1 Tax=Haloactinopolyspora alba TaxID=648780 RepID=A0A2P8EF52_9ACTN|nr:dihydrofolate reductase family protein [Haloactinopolyspora alba]PSL08081.1 dihydrofolate reductase [Haloactinopolyspora alba]
MRKIVAWMFMSLDGVIEAPEQWAMFNDEMGKIIDEQAADADTLLLGRRTYEVFAGSWPQRSTADDPHAEWMNSTPKLVASTSLEHVDWQNSELISGGVAETLAEVKQGPGKNILINGSATLVRSLLEAGVLDELGLFVHPLVLGTGTRLFEPDGSRIPLHVTESRTLDTGVLYVRYQPV